MMCVFHRVALTACVLGAGSGVMAGPALRSARVQPQPETQVTALSGQVELARLIDLAVQRLGLNIDYDSAAVKGSATLRLGSSLTDEELWLLLNRLLASRGFTTVRAAGERSYSVVRLADAPNVVQFPGAGAAGVSAGFVLVGVRVQHRPTKEVLDAVSKVLSKPGGSAQAVGDGGLILIADLAPRVEHAQQVIRLVDVPCPPAAVHEIAVHSMAAPGLTSLVTQVSAKREVVSGEKIPGEVVPSPNGGSVLLICPSDREGYWRGLIASLDKREQVQTLGYTPRSFALKDVARLVDQTIKDVAGVPADDRWRLVEDDLTGTLIITATPSQHEQIGALIDRLNGSQTSVQRPVRSYVIKNRPVREVQAVLEHLLSSGVIGVGGVLQGEPKGEARGGGLAPWPPPGASAVQPPGSRGAGGQAAPPSPKGPANEPTPVAAPTVVYTADEGTNTLMAMAEPRALAQIESLLRTIDVRQPQVMLEVLIVSLSDSQTMDLGVELERLVTSGDVRIRLSSLFGLGTRGAGGDRTVGDGSGGTGLVLSPGDFSILLRALQTINRGRSVSMPRLLVANNQQGVLDSILDQPYASTNASNTVTTTSYGGSSPAGTQVTLKPQIGAGDHLNLEYSISLSAFVGAPSSANLPPPKQQNKVQSAASLPDGYTVALGGIELNTEGQGTSQVPGLGSIPILGEVFKNRSKNASRSRFYVFIRANVMRNESFEDLKYLSDKGTAVAGVDDGFPVVEPRVIR